MKEFAKMEGFVTDKIDALGNKIVIGQIYGYAVDNSGRTTSSVGRAIALTPTGMISLKLLRRIEGLWNGEPKVEIAEGKRATVKAMKLFPVRLEDINKEVDEFIYKGYFCDEAEEFFKGNVIKEERDGVAVVGHFIVLANGNTHLPSKGDKFIKDSSGEISVISAYR